MPAESGGVGGKALGELDFLDEKGNGELAFGRVPHGERQRRRKRPRRARGAAVCREVQRRAAASAATPKASKRCSRVQGGATTSGGAGCNAVGEREVHPRAALAASPYAS